ncbi:Metallo-dependent phosphatase [Dothidotthia symphoricarpi CBS 119687]|uniref:Metallo-dependent phosphatase n=1 Tax=Dothidotthia symphoricarpi CBS 119687 TaxID=1392245 RepID=A0A6A6ASS0_9PLEO|nr:Metallo-dependent phosphatase [Dothidotthia symphoricarpi CBS 119687]KAF2133591.1 Metallo-dependent phosphatase [Dothidotthia symphoricarpi CBS 119687]
MVFEVVNPWHRPKDFEPLPLAALVYQAPVKSLLFRAYRVATWLRSAPTPSNPPLRVVCISDTHNHILDNVPPGDILIHAGDMTNTGSVAELQRQVDWLASLPHKEIMVISGNHDTYLDPRTRPSLQEEQRSGNVDWGRVHYLQHRRLSLTITVDPRDSGSRTPLLAERRQRRIHIYGAPQIPACGPMAVHAFQYPRGQDAWSETVPDDTDILITHTPPKHHLDLAVSQQGIGCEHLLAEVKRVKPSLHVFGHVHWGAGQTVVWWDRTHEAYTRGLSVQSKWTHGVLNPRLWWSVVRVAYRGMREVIWDRVWGGQSAYTIMVNAAQTHGNTGKLGNAVQVVDI